MGYLCILGALFVVKSRARGGLVALCLSPRHELPRSVPQWVLPSLALRGTPTASLHRSCACGCSWHRNARASDSSRESLGS